MYVVVLSLTLMCVALRVAFMCIMNQCVAPRTQRVRTVMFAVWALAHCLSLSTKVTSPRCSPNTEGRVVSLVPVCWTARFQSGWDTHAHRPRRGAHYGRRIGHVATSHCWRVTTSQFGHMGNTRRCRLYSSCMNHAQRPYGPIFMTASYTCVPPTNRSLYVHVNVSVGISHPNHPV